MTAQHKDQIASVLRRAVQEVLTRGLNDPRIRGLVSVTSIKVSNDLAEATILISILPEQHETLTLKGLQSAAGHIRKEVGRKVTMRRLPRLSFEIDESYKREQATLAAISRAVAGGDEEVLEEEGGG